MGTNTGASYEVLLREIFQEILDQDIVNNVTVSRNVTLQGKTVSHQIDLYWEFTIGGITYANVVQAKDWKTPVTKGELLTFRGVLDDLPGQPRGIFATKTGYQAGAATYAQAHGIQLYTLAAAPAPSVTITDTGYASIRILTPTDGNRQLEVTTGSSTFTRSAYQIDGAWWRIATRSLNPTSTEAIRSRRIVAPPREIQFTDEHGAPQLTLRDVYASLVTTMRKDAVTHRNATHSFTAPTYFATGDPALPRVKVIGVTTTIDINETRQVFPFPSFTGFILKNLTNGTERRFAKKTRQGSD
jgi:hypothetical protein